MNNVHWNGGMMYGNECITAADTYGGKTAAGTYEGKIAVDIRRNRI